MQEAMVLAILTSALLDTLVTLALKMLCAFASYPQNVCEKQEVQT